MRAEAANGRLMTTLSAGQVVRGSWGASLVRRLSLGGRGVTVLTCLICSVPSSALVLAGTPLWAAALGGVALAGTLGTWLSHYLSSPVRAVINAANQMAAGDLSSAVSVTGSGESAELQLALAQLNVTVRTIVRDVREEIENLKHGANEIAAGNLDLSARTEAQASNLEQTAASMDEISGTVQQTAATSSEGANLAQETSMLAKRSHEAVTTVGTTMREISESSSRIGAIIQVIEGVAFQTNILALNAAVEAARAGDQGRGFAVVASEVRALAQRTTGAAREIRTLIEESRDRVSDGNRHANEAQVRMDEAMASVDRVRNLLVAISASTREQSVGASQVSEAVAQLDTITQQNAAMVEELSAAASSLNEQVVQVSQTIRVFKLAASEKTLAEEDAVELRRRGKEEAGTG
jgi:aerotaxis receptor